MTIKETAAIMEILTIAYPNWKVDGAKALKLWANMFADDDPEQVALAVKAYIATDTSGFAPSIGQIKTQIVKMESASMPTDQDAWTHIRAAISNSGYHSGEEFAKLTPIEQRIVGSPRQLYDWALMDVDTLDSVVASNVQRAYRRIQEREQYKLALPAKLVKQLEAFEGREQIEQISREEDRS